MNGSIIKVIENTLNYVDPRLIHHGRRVAYLTYQVLRRQGRHSDELLEKLLLLALLHDIGAYKTEEIDNMVRFETASVWEHSVYSHLFIKHFSPLTEMAPVLLFHHAGCAELRHVPASIREAAQIIHVADRFDILTQTSDLSPSEFKGQFTQAEGQRFDASTLDLFFHSDWKHLFDGVDDNPEFHRLLYGRELDREGMHAFVSMLALTIDFRSAQTVAHTQISTEACLAIAEYLTMDKREREGIFAAVMLHDLGKISTPLHILEKPGKLDKQERKIMEQHVAVGKRLLAGALDECCLRMAVRHHERLDGSGYPEGLAAKDLTTGQRLVAVGDILSALCSPRTYKEAYPKPKILRIMEKMAANGLIDPEITTVVLTHYDVIVRKVEKAVLPALKLHSQIQAEYAALMRWVRRLQPPGERISQPLGGSDGWMPPNPMPERIHFEEV